MSNQSQLTEILVSPLPNLPISMTYSRIAVDEEGKGISSGMIAHLQEKSTVTTTPETSGVARGASQYPLYSLPIEGCVYRGEGNANLVVAVPSERRVIRLRKSAAGDARGLDSAESCNQEEDVRRDVEFIRSVISDLLYGYVRVPEILRVGQSEIARLANKIRPARPESRRHKDIFAGFATRLPDYAFLPEHLSNFSGKPTFCVEIKPKQGFICEADRLLNKCPYCLMQYYKTRSRGSVDAAEPEVPTRQQRSGYCPLDLFSAHRNRVEKAIRCLLRSPQNNLRIFRDGELAYGQVQMEHNGEVDLRMTLSGCFGSEDDVEDEDMLVRLVAEAIGRPFFEESEEERDGFREMEEAEEAAMREFERMRVEVEEWRPDGSMIHEVNELIDKYGQECKSPSSWSPPVSGASKSTPNLDSGSSGWRSSVTSRILRMQSLHRCGSDFVAWSRARCSYLLHDDMTHPDLVQARDSHSRQEVMMNAKCTPDEDKTDNDSVRKNIKLEHLVNVLINYLLFCTARDCSILIAFQEVNRESCSSVNPIHRIDLSEDRSYLVSVRVVDLDLKKLSCIDKHRRRDENVLRATLDALREKLDS